MIGRKEFQAIANAVNSVSNNSTAAGLNRHELISELSNALAKLNPRFDAGKFEAACLAVPKR